MTSHCAGTVCMREVRKRDKKKKENEKTAEGGVTERSIRSSHQLMKLSDVKISSAELERRMHANFWFSSVTINTWK